MEVDFEGLSLSNLYRASDALVKHREALEDHLFGRARDLFDLKETVTLFDLTNTYFEGERISRVTSRGQVLQSRIHPNPTFNLCAYASPSMKLSPKDKQAKTPANRNRYCAK